MEGAKQCSLHGHCRPRYHSLIYLPQGVGGVSSLHTHQVGNSSRQTDVGWRNGPEYHADRWRKRKPRRGWTKKTPPERREWEGYQKMQGCCRMHGRDEESTMVLQFTRHPSRAILQRAQRLTEDSVNRGPKDRPTEERSTDRVWLHCVW